VLVGKMFHQMVSPKRFYQIAGRCLPWLWIAFAVFVGYGLIDGLFIAPPDYQQGDGYRIIYFHVPAAMMSMGAYLFISINSFVFLVWKVKLADVFAKVTVPLGATFALLALLTGALWGKPMWGAWWIWDARLTSELILLLLYCGLIALRSAIPDTMRAAKASAILALVGVVDLPIIHYSVYWWHTLHQKSTILRWGQPTISLPMLYPLLAMIAAFVCYFVAILFWSAREEILRREAQTKWVDQLRGVAA